MLILTVVIPVRQQLHGTLCILNVPPSICIRSLRHAIRACVTGEGASLVSSCINLDAICFSIKFMFRPLK